MCMNVMLAFIYIHCLQAWSPWRSNRDGVSPVTEVANNHKLPSRFWTPNPDPLQKQQVINC